MHKSSAVPITKPQTVVDLDIPPARLGAAVGDLDRAAPVELVLRDVTAASHPGVLFDVFLAKKGAPESAEHVGTISWFGAFRHHGTSGPVKKTLTYDVTDALRALGGDALRTTGLSVIVEATEGRDSSDPARSASLRTSGGRRLPGGVEAVDRRDRAAGGAAAAELVGVARERARAGLRPGPGPRAAAPRQRLHRALARLRVLRVEQTLHRLGRRLPGLDERAHQRLADLVVGLAAQRVRDRGRSSDRRRSG